MGRIFAVLVVFGLVVGTSATVGTGIHELDGAVDDGLNVTADILDTSAEIIRNATNDTSESPTPSTVDSDSGDGFWSYDVQNVEEHFTTLLNEERRSRGLSPVSRKVVLREMGISHSQYMARAGQIGHSGLGDGSIKDRFRKRGLLPECRISMGNNRFYPGAENAAKTWIDQQVYSERGSYSINSEKELARGLFNQWMNSTGHRRPMMASNLESIGLGFEITEEGEVFAALEMCGA